MGSRSRVWSSTRYTDQHRKDHKNLPRAGTLHLFLATTAESKPTLLEKIQKLWKRCRCNCIRLLLNARRTRIHHAICSWRCSPTFTHMCSFISKAPCTSTKAHACPGFYSLGSACGLILCPAPSPSALQIVGSLTASIGLVPYALGCDLARSKQNPELRMPYLQCRCSLHDAGWRQSVTRNCSIVLIDGACSQFVTLLRKRNSSVETSMETSLSHR